MRVIIITILFFLTFNLKSQTQVDFFTNYGDFRVELYDSLVPITTGNFISLVNSNFYDGALFHRVIKNKGILEELEKITRTTEKYPFIESNIINQKNQLNNIVRVNGFYLAQIKVQIISNNNNSIDFLHNFLFIIKSFGVK